MQEELILLKEDILLLLEEKKFAPIRQCLEYLNPADVAILLAEMPRETLTLFFRLLPKELAAQTFIEMDGDEQEYLIEAFSDRELKEVLDELYLDDTVDIIEEMPANVVKRILKHTDPDTRKTINQLLSYPKDSAGSIMTVEYIDLKKDMTVEQAFARIRRIGVDKETIYSCYVTDQNKVLLGFVSVKDLLLNNYDCVIEDIMQTNIIFVNTHDDKEAVAQLFSKYDFIAMPVVDKEHRLVGIVTFDDAMDVIEEETTEDIEKMAAITPSDKPYMKTGIVETWKKRIPWLLLLMISATFTGKIIASYEEALAATVVLTTFIPMFMDTGGNAGGQASITVIRSLSLNEIAFNDLPKILWKEVRVAFLCGITLAAGNFIKMMLIDKVSVSIAFVVCLTLVITVLCAKTIGCCLPIVSKKLGFDPAVMSSPFITTIVDALSLIIYFNIAIQILHI